MALAPSERILLTRLCQPRLGGVTAKDSTSPVQTERRGFTMKTPPTQTDKISSDITFSDCLESVRYEIEDALKLFPENKELFLHQIRLLLDQLAQ